MYIHALAHAIMLVKVANGLMETVRLPVLHGSVAGITCALGCVDVERGPVELGGCPSVRVGMVAEPSESSLF